MIHDLFYNSLSHVLFRTTIWFLKASGFCLHYSNRYHAKTCPEWLRLLWSDVDYTAEEAANALQATPKQLRELVAEGAAESEGSG